MADARREDQTKALAREAQRAIEKLVSFVFDERVPGGLSVELQFDESGALASDLVGGLKQLQSLHAASIDAFQSGAVYCYSCSSADCPHSHPPKSVSVFSKYSSSGKPEWAEFVQKAIEHKSPLVDKLYLNRAPLLAFYELGRDLKKDQLSVFGKSSRSYSLLGQVIAGYFRHAGEKFALTFQLVETIEMKSKPRLNLNVIAEQSVDVSDYLFHRDGEALKFAVDQIIHEVHVINERLQKIKSAKQTSEVLRAVPGILRDFTTHLRRLNNVKARRTLHARERRRESRPIATAIEDLRQASSERFFHDTKEDTLIVWGPKNRVHVFSKEATHVTSLHLEKASIMRRVKSQRWRPSNSEQMKLLGGLVSPAPE